MNQAISEWISFAIQTVPAAAILAFLFMFVTGTMLSLMFLWDGHRDIWLLFLGPLMGAAGAVDIGILVALLGWPALWLIEQVFGPNPALKSWALSVVSLNQASLLIATGAGLAVPAAFFVWVALDKSAVPPVRRKAMQVMPQNQTRDRNRISEGCHRIGIAVGVLFGLPLLLIGLFSPENLVGAAIVATIVFLILYGFMRLLGWIINGFVGANERSGKEI